MKTVVIYTSQTGFTKRYAEWIAEAAGADCMELTEDDLRTLAMSRLILDNVPHIKAYWVMYGKEVADKYMSPPCPVAAVIPAVGVTRLEFPTEDYTTEIGVRGRIERHVL